MIAGGNHTLIPNQPPASADPDRRKREADCLPYGGDSKIQKVHDVIGNFLLRHGLIWFLGYYELCRGIHAEDNRTVPWPQCAKGPFVQRGLAAKLTGGLSMAKQPPMFV